MAFRAAQAAQHPGGPQRRRTLRRTSTKAEIALDTAKKGAGCLYVLLSWDWAFFTLLFHKKTAQEQAEYA